MFITCFSLASFLVYMCLPLPLTLAYATNTDTRRYYTKGYQQLQSHAITEAYRPLGGVFRNWSYSLFNWLLFTLICILYSQLHENNVTPFMVTGQVRAGPASKWIRAPKAVPRRHGQVGPWSTYRIDRLIQGTTPTFFNNLDHIFELMEQYVE